MLLDPLNSLKITGLVVAPLLHYAWSITLTDNQTTNTLLCVLTILQQQTF